MMYAIITQSNLIPKPSFLYREEGENEGTLHMCQNLPEILGPRILP